MKKAFSLAEVMITLGILAFVLWLSFPLINFQPGNDRLFIEVTFPVFKISMEEVTDSLAYSKSRYWGADAAFSADHLCSYIANVADTVGTLNCGATSSVDNPNFSLTNGAIVWGLDNDMTSRLTTFINSIPLPSAMQGPPTTLSFDSNKNGVTDIARGDKSNDQSFSYTNTGGGTSTANLSPPRIYVDVNGATKGPNVNGQDRFQMVVVPYKVTNTAGAWTYNWTDLRVMAPTASTEEGLLIGKNKYAQ